MKLKELLSIMMILSVISACNDTSESISSELSNNSSSEIIISISESSESVISIESSSIEISSEESSSLSEEISVESSEPIIDSSSESSSESEELLLNGNDKVMEHLFNEEIAILKLWENESFKNSMISKNRNMDEQTQETFLEMFKECEMESLPIYDESTNQYTQLYQDTYSIKDECLYIEISFYNFIDCFLYVDHEGHLFTYGNLNDDMWYRSTNPLDKGEIKKYLIRVGNKTVSLEDDKGENVNHNLINSIKKDQVTNLVVTKDYNTYLYGLPSEIKMVSNQFELQILLASINNLTVSELPIKDLETGEYSEEYLKYLESNPTDAYADIVFNNNNYGCFYANKEGYIYTFVKGNEKVWYKSNETIDVNFLLIYLGIEKPEWNN